MNENYNTEYDNEFPAMSYEHYCWLCDIDDKLLENQLKNDQFLNEFYQKLASEQKDTTPEFEAIFRKNFRRLLSKTK